MSDRYNHGNGSERNIRNTDNEDTMYIPSTNDYDMQQPAANLPPLHRTNRTRNSSSSRKEQYGSQQQNYQNQQYYGDQQYYENQQQNPQFYNNQQYYDNIGQYYGGYNNSGTEYSGPQPQAYYQPEGNYNRPQRQRPVRKKNKRKHKSIIGSIIRRVITTLLILFLLLFGIYSCTSLSLIHKVNHEESGKRNHISDALDESYVTSILIIGTDGRSVDDRGRSDSMILLSLNSKTNEIIMTSFMRDSYVEIPGYGYNKLNASYAFGGPDLLMDTIEYNFGVRIDDYVSINFNSFASIIDSVGGLELEVSDAEAEEINVILISEVNELMGDDRMSDLLDSGGKLHLNGKQVLSYSRIRNVGNSDFERTERQRTVVTELIKKLGSFKPSIFKNIASDVIPDISTNMSTLEMYLYSLRLPFAVRYDTKQIQIPYDGTFYGNIVYIDGYESSVLEIDDFDANYNVLRDEVFSDDK